MLPSLPLNLYPVRTLSDEQSSYVSDNEFEVDHLNSGGYVSDNEDIDEDTDILMTLHKLKIMDALELCHHLLNEDILFDSLLTLCTSSTHMNTYMDCAGILTKSYLYIIPAINYQIWLDFKERARLDELINNHSSHRITNDIAQQLVSHLDLTNNKILSKKMASYFIDKTKKEIKINILANIKRIANLSSAFLNDSMELKQSITDSEHVSTDFKLIKHVMIEQFFDTDIISRDTRDALLLYLLQEIASIDEHKVKKNMIITLHKYHNISVIHALNERKREYLQNINSFLCEDVLRIKPFNDNIKYANLAIDLKQFSTLEICNDDNGIQLKHDTKDGLFFKFKSNNTRFEWFCYLDYAINHDRNIINVEQKQFDGEQHINNKAKMMQDFTDQNSENASYHFSFGVYLNYWQQGYENSVTPKYRCLKEELTSNSIANITEAQYYALYKDCIRLLHRNEHKLKAKYIGINNKKLNIPKGTKMSINHVISLKLYTDFGKVIQGFKRYCCRINRDESIHDLVSRNRNIAHWCRYIKESCTFWGNKMKKADTFYTGLKQELMFDSMKQLFECPLSTTTELAIANNFCANGIILKLKAANSRTKYFDVSWLSHFPKENERLFMGSSLKICDIIIHRQTHATYIRSIQLLEQIVSGEFIDTKPKREHNLYRLITCCIAKKDNCKTNDIGMHSCGKYIENLFQNVVNRIKTDNEFEIKTLWINKQQLDKIQHNELQLWFDVKQGLFWNYIAVNAQNIPNIQVFEWQIADEEYDAFKNMKARQYIKSQAYKYKLDEIGFYLRCCAQYSDESRNAALFFHLEPDLFRCTNIESIQIEYYLFEESTKYKNTMSAQWLSRSKPHCGFQTFSTHKLNKKKRISWKIGIKILQITHRKFDLHVDILEDKAHEPTEYDMCHVYEAIQTQNMHHIQHICQCLIEENKLLRFQQMDMKSRNTMRDSPKISDRDSDYSTAFMIEHEMPQFGRRPTNEIFTQSGDSSIINNKKHHGISYEYMDHTGLKKYIYNEHDVHAPSAKPLRLNKQLTVAQSLPLVMETPDDHEYDADSEDAFDFDDTKQMSVIQRVKSITYDRLYHEDTRLDGFITNKQALFTTYLIPQTNQFRCDEHQEAFVVYVDKVYNLLNAICIWCMLIFMGFIFAFIANVTWKHAGLLGACWSALIVLFLISFYSKMAYIKTVSFTICIGIVLLYIMILYTICGDLTTDRFLLCVGITLSWCSSIGYISSVAYFVLTFVIFIEYNSCVLLQYFEITSIGIAADMMSIKEIMYGNCILLLMLGCIAFAVLRMQKQVVFEFIAALESESLRKATKIHDEASAGLLLNELSEREKLLPHYPT